MLFIVPSNRVSLFDKPYIHAHVYTSDTNYMMHTNFNITSDKVSIAIGWTLKQIQDEEV